MSQHSDRADNRQIVRHAEQEWAAVSRYPFGQSSIRTAKSRGHYNYLSDLTDE